MSGRKAPGMKLMDIDQRPDKMLFKLPYYMKFWRHFNLAILAIFQKIAKLKCTKIKCR